MIVVRRVWALGILTGVLSLVPVSGEVLEFSVSRQPVGQVLLAFAERSGLSIVADRTVRGQVSLVLHDLAPERALREIATAAGLFLRSENGVHYLSKVRVTEAEGRWSVESRGGSLGAIVRAVSRVAMVEVSFGELTDAALYCSVTAPSPEELVLRAAEAAGIDAADRSGTLVLGRDAASMPTPPAAPRDPLSVHVSPAGIELAGAPAPIGTVVRELARAVDRSVVYCAPLPHDPIDVALHASRLDRALALLAARADVALYDTGDALVVAQHHDGARLTPLTEFRHLVVPTADRPAVRSVATTSVGVTVEEETATGLLVSGFPGPLRRLQAVVDDLSRPRRAFITYRPGAAEPRDLLSLTSLRFPESDLAVPDGGDVLCGWVPTGQRQAVLQWLQTQDRGTIRRVYHCSHLPVADAIEAITTLSRRARPVAGSDGRSLSVLAPPDDHDDIRALLQDIDRPRRQVRFDLCIIQYHAGDAVRYGVDLSAEHSGGVTAPLADGTPLTGAAAFAGVLDLRFDLVSQLGYRAALAISDELSNNSARLVLDSRVRALDGETARIENSTTFRYRDVLGDPEEAGWQSVVREIDTGLVVELTGRTHRDRSVTVDVAVETSRQGADMRGEGDPPPTSQRVVESTVRVRPGEPFVVGGLLHAETSASERRFPVLGRLPLLRRITNLWQHQREQSELVLYLTVVPDPGITPEERARRQLRAVRSLELEAGDS